jgi:hypothetical protein
MIHIITAVGIVVCALALAGLAAPALLTRIASRVAESKPLRITAVAARIVFGAIAVLVAEQTLYPWPMKILGVIFIMGGTLVAMTSREKLNRWIDEIKSNDAWGRALSAAALAVGGFLVHASL